MEIKKDYELRRLGSKIILRQIDAETYEFRTTLVADSLIEEKQKNLFILRSGDYFALFREKDYQLQSIRGCSRYLFVDGMILLYLDQWYWWTDEFKLVLLGKQIGKSSVVFLLKTEDGCSLNYFSEGKLRQVGGSEYRILAGKELSFFKANLLQIKTSEGWRFVNIVCKSEPVCYPGIKFPEHRTSSKVILSKVPMDKVIDYYDFVQEFQKQKKDFGVIIGFGKNFADMLWEEQIPTNGLVLLPCFGNSLQDMGVTINADTWRLFNGETEGVYRVRSKILYYDRVADEVEMGELDGMPCLIIRFSGQEERIAYRKKGLKSEIELFKNESAS